ncbi:MAG TPA: glycosyl hydrolase [Usitatibacteraceae bacterium]|nr:glycosyl hydrolase [Usitatibacteraceae bacterium]
MSKNQTRILVSTRKGLFVLAADRARQAWKVDGAMPRFHGQIVHHAVMNPATGTLLAAARPGHLGPTVFRSVDLGRTWTEAKAPPAFAPGSGTGYGWTVHHVFWIARGHASAPRTWYAGTSPHGLFRSEDDGLTWTGVEGFNRHPDRPLWLGDEKENIPDGAIVHSVNVDPFDARHIMLGMSPGGVFESFDEGATWSPLNRGCAADFLPDPEADWGHDPHCLRMHPAARDVVYQQNHCGIYRLDRAAKRWERIGANMPKAIGDIGFPMTLHPRDPARLWVFPMDGTSVWPRMSIAGKPAVYGSKDAGRTWKRMDRGLPKAQGWFTVKRQAMGADQADPLGLYFGTTGGEVWASFDEGAQWHCLMLHLPQILAIEAYTL